MQGIINEGLYQLGAHEWCVNISAVTQFGTLRKATLFTGHKDRKQATGALPSAKSWAFQRIYSFSKDLKFRGEDTFYSFIDRFRF